MRKRFFPHRPAVRTSLAAILLGLVLALVPAACGLAHASEAEEAQAAHRAEVRFGRVDSDTTLGAALRLHGDWWVAANLDHLGTSAGPTFSVTGVYHVPKPFLFWETDYPLAAGSDALHRSGFRVEF